MATYLMKNIAVGLLSRKNKLTLKEQGTFLTRASDMLQNGFTLLDVLQFFKKLDQKKHHMMESMMKDLKKGHKIHEVFLKHHFDQEACVQLYFSEKHGFLAEALLESGAYLQRKDEERRKLFKLMQYPLILLFILLLVAILLNTLLLPRFQYLYQSMGYEPSVGIKLILHLMQNIPFYLLLFILLLVAILLNTLLLPRFQYLYQSMGYEPTVGIKLILHFMQNVPFYLLLSILFGLSVYLFMKRNFRNKSALDIAAFFSSFPFINSYYKLYQTIFISREWGYLLRSGFSMNEIITIMESQTFRPLLQESAQKLKNMLLVGHSFGEALSTLSFIEKEMIFIVNHGDINGRIEKELLYYSQHCLRKLEEKTETIFLVVQPIIFLFIGVIIVTIYMSIFLPMFQMMDSI